MIEAIQHAVMWVCLWTLAALAVCALLSLVARRKQVRPVFAHIPPVPCVVLLVVMAVCTLFSGKNTNSPPAGIMSPLLPRSTGGTPVVTLVVTPEEIAQGYRLENVTTNDVVSYTMPTNGVVYTPWTLRGGYETHFPLDLGDFAFPFGTGVVHRLDVLSGGMVESFPRPSCMSICAAREWASLIPGESGFWWADLVRPEPAPYHVKLLTWENVYAGRDRTGLYSAQIELWSDGNFLTRSNNVENVYRRVTPFDWDDDGLENSVDPDPYVAGPDAHGTNAEWYNIVCSNVLEATTATILPELMWREGVNSNGYYFVDVVTTNGPAPIYFMGDRESRLGNPVVVARACETNHVPLLIGVDYAITSSVPFTVSISEDYTYPVMEADGPCCVHVRWPLNFVFNESIGESNRVYTVSVEPFDPGGVLEWTGAGGGVPMRGELQGEGCDCMHYGVSSVWFACSSARTCNMGCTAEGCYHLENASFLVRGGQCRCGFDDPPPDVPSSSAHEPNDPPSLTITFSKQAVIFEDAYENSPGVTVPRRSTRVRLTIDAYGGVQGGALWLTGANMSKLTIVSGDVVLPYSQTLGAHESYHATGVYEGAAASESVDDVIVSGIFTEEGTASQISASNMVTVVRVELSPEVTAPENDRVHRHSFGVREGVLCSSWPTLPQSAWQSSSDGRIYSVVGSTYFMCPILAARNPLSIMFAGAVYTPMTTVIEPAGIVARNPRAYNFEFPKDIAGGAGMALQLHVTPLNVSFVGIAVEEVPTTTGIHTGYFADSSWQLAWYHTDDRGAGDWRNVQSGNFFMEDSPAMAEECSPPWQTGSLVWDIPIGWGERNRVKGDVPVKTCSEIYNQTFELTSNGTLSITKFGHVVTRTTNDVIFLDGRRVK